MESPSERDATRLKQAAAGVLPVPPVPVQQKFEEGFDAVVPRRSYQQEQMVGLGGSAGSIQALQQFFRAMPAQSGMVFVVILHLSPEHESVLPAMLARCTPMPVLAAEDGMKVALDHVYVIPPGKHLVVTDGHLRLTPLEPEHGRRVAVDLFFRSLADVHGPQAAAIVLSGADGDGAIGIKRIKERGGLTMAQDPAEAEHHGMPQSAIATGMVDWVLPVAEMPGRLLEYQAAGRRQRLPPEEGPQPAQPLPTTTDEDEAALREVLHLLKARTGRDFSFYKRATIVRRISRRMQIGSVDTVPAYLSLLRTQLGESGALLQDMLISVTNFFRDREAFAALETMVPRLFHDKQPEDCVRVWVAACATGEEAYSIAMLLLEHARMLEDPPGLQVFACDLDELAVQHARAGFYPATIAADVSEDRLRRFFTPESGGYRVRRELREVVLFANHDLLKDAPFSRLDLISCRNLLIYLNQEGQQRALDILHFALCPQGLLFLGASETVEDGSPLFRTVDKQHRLFARLPGFRGMLPVPGETTLLRALRVREHAPVLPGPSFQPAETLPPREPVPGLEHLSLDELHYRLTERIAPPSVLVNSEHEVVHLSQNAGRVLLLAGGSLTVSLMRLVPPALQGRLRVALQQAVETGRSVEVAPVVAELPGGPQTVGMRVEPASDLAPGYALILFAMKNVEDGDAAPPSTLLTEVPEREQLERELGMLKSRSRHKAEQYEARGEEWKADKEELQAMNEELRSASEELETSREELQSLNEELTTVNQELKSKLEDLNHANSDLRNHMAATLIATVFLDRDLCIMRYTPSAAPLFRMIPGDVGRPLADLRHAIEYPDLASDSQQVLESLVPMEREVRTGDGHWFLARLLPYRTQDDHIAGVVLSFVEITDHKRAEAEVRARNSELERFHAVVVDRELRMTELKAEVNSLLDRLDEPPRYQPPSGRAEPKREDSAA